MRVRLLALAGVLACIAGCSKEPAVPQTGTSGGPLLVKLYPSIVVAGEKFNVQADGTSTLAVACQNVNGTAEIVFGPQTLAAVVAQKDPPNCFMSATIPQDMTNKPGAYPVYIRTGQGVSNRLDFIVKPK